MTTLTKRSTSRLLFAHDAAFQKQDGTYVEVEDLFHTTSTNRFNSKYNITKFQDSRFWRALSTRYWQYDDFSFGGVAAASFLGTAHRYKIWFNPIEAYRLLMTAAMDVYGSIVPETEGKKGKKGKTKVEDAFDKTKEEIEKEKIKAETEWEKLISGNSRKANKLSSDYGWDQVLYDELVKSQKQGAWTEEGWYRWNNIITNFDYISVNLVSIMIHEMMHVLWEHLNRHKFDPMQWNLATDYAINQTLDFTPEIQKVCITKNNETFFQRFVISYVRYKLQQEVELRKSTEKKYGLTIQQDIREFCQVALPNIDKLYNEFMTEGNYYHSEDITEKKPADFYFRILEETMVFSSEGEGDGEGEGKGKGKGSGSGVRGYDDHGQWDESDSGAGDDGEDEDEDEADEKGKGADGSDGDEDAEDGDGKGKEKNKQAGGRIDQKRKASKGGKSKKSSGGGSASGASSKERGKGEGEGNVHGGWDVTTACARQEAKGAIRDAMQRAGFDPDDPADLEKCLNRTPGMESLGAHISEWFKVPTKNWRQILNKYVATAMQPQQMDYTMSRENRRLPGVFPGKRRERGLELIIAVDTSGSINYNDYNDFISQIEKIGRDCDIDNVRLIQCHHSIALDKKLPLRRVKTTPIVETGGTTMRVIYETLKREKNRKLLILCTDGAIDHFKNDGWGFKSIMFLSRGNECYADALKERGFPVICQDQE